MTAEELREQINARIFALETRVEPFTNIRDLRVPCDGYDITARAYTPEGIAPQATPQTGPQTTSQTVPQPLLVYVHGAAWIAGSLDTHDNLCRRLATRVPCVVLSVGYRLAPEHRFPAAIEDSYGALAWAVANTERLGIDPRRVAIGGDSAGGNIAAAVCLMARDRGSPAIGLQLLVNPALDFTAYDAKGFEESKQYREYYLKDPTDANKPYASPMLARDVAGLPPAFVITGDQDVLMPEGEAYVRRLRVAGVPANAYRQIGKGHQSGHFARATAEAEEAMDLCVAVLRAAYKRMAAGRMLATSNG